MKKAEAIALLGGTPSAVARAIGISSQAVSLWPDELPSRISDRVEAALWRMSRVAAGAPPVPEPEPEPEPARDAA